MQRIEASAGTGKTWTLSGLLLRLVVEKGLAIDRILTVTFTKAATAELRERVRQRLQAMLDRLQRGAGSGSASVARDCGTDSAGPGADGYAGAGDGETDLVCASIAQRCADHDLAVRRTQAALRGFDDAPIYTIHGFCQRALADRALACGLPFALDVVPDAQAMLLEVVEDFWRREIAHTAPSGNGLDDAAQQLFVTWLMHIGATPEDLAAWLEPLLDKAQLRIDLPAGRTDPPVGRHDAPPEGAADPPDRRVAQVRALWLAERADIVGRLVGNTALKANMYAAASIPRWAGEIDAYLAAGGDVFTLPEHFEKFTTRGLAQGTKKNASAPLHPFFSAAEALLDSRDALAAWCAARWLEMRLRLLAGAAAEVRRRLTDRRMQSYRDMLVNLRDALHGAGGERLAAALRLRYPAALIDEFQDTDPIQYQIFRRIYMDRPADSTARSSSIPQSEPAAPDHDTALFLVGDPKQAIYGFRGADVFAYLGAAAAAPHKHTLTENQRSVAPLVGAVNALFSANSKAFVFDGIEFVSVEASRRSKDALIEGAAGQAALRFFVIAPRDDRKPHNKGDADDWAVQATAREVARLLREAAAGQATLGERPLRAGDLAILVDTGRHGTMVRRALAQLGIASALRTQDSVFRSREAVQLERVLLAIFEPQRDALVRAALTTELMGERASHLVRYGGELLDSLPTQDNRDDQNDESDRNNRNNRDDPDGQDDRDDQNAARAAWELRLAQFHEYHELWRRHGVMRMFRRLLVEQGVTERLSAFDDGPRRLTNLFHLAELIHAESQRRPGIEMQLAWIASQRRNPSGAEENELRLESDQDLIQILTVHASKGLEYPVTFIPFLWQGSSRVEGKGSGSSSGTGSGKASDRVSEPVFYHDPSADHCAALDFGSERIGTARACARGEELAERIRLAYVAVTRARNRCYVCWGQIKDAQGSALGWLLHGNPATGFVTAVDPPSDDAIRQRLALLSSASAGAIAIAPDEPPPQVSAPQIPTPQVSQPEVPQRNVPPPEILPPPSGAPPHLAARVLAAPLPVALRLASFSALNDLSGNVADDQPLDGGRAEQPDHDQRAGASAPDDTGDDGRDGPIGQRRPAGGGRFAFPRGAAAGQCLHDILEQIDFSLSGSSGSWDAALHSALLEAGYPQSWAAELGAWLSEVCATPLPVGPAAGPSGAGSTGPPIATSSEPPTDPSHGQQPAPFALATVARSATLRELEFHLPWNGVDIARIPALAVRHGYPLAPLPAERIAGFLKGFIDLVVLRDGRFYIADYKSNWLGGQRDAYRPAALARAMRANGYQLQALLYTVAVHRWLAGRDPGYSYDGRFGGVQYLFLRGMHPEWQDSDGAPLGVHWDRPPIALIHELDALFDNAARSDPSTSHLASAKRTGAERNEP